MKNARNKKNFVNYVFNIVLNDKNVNIIIIDITQILFAYKHMNDELKRDLFKFIKVLIMFNLLEKLRHQKNIWFDIYEKDYKARLFAITSNRQNKDK